MLKEAQLPAVVISSQDEGVTPFAGTDVGYNFVCDVRHLMQADEATSQGQGQSSRKTKQKKRSRAAATAVKAKDVQGHCGDRPIEELLTFIDNTSKSNKNAVSSSSCSKMQNADSLSKDRTEIIPQVTDDKLDTDAVTMATSAAGNTQIRGRLESACQQINGEVDSGATDEDAEFTVVGSSRRREKRRRQVLSSLLASSSHYRRLTPTVSSPASSTIHQCVDVSKSVLHKTHPSHFTKSFAWVAANASLTASHVTADDSCSSTSDLGSSCLSEVKDISETGSIDESLLLEGSLTSSLTDSLSVAMEIPSAADITSHAKPPVVFVGKKSYLVTQPVDITFGFSISDTLICDTVVEEPTFNYKQVVSFLKTRWNSVQQLSNQHTSRSVVIYD